MRIAGLALAAVVAVSSAFADPHQMTVQVGKNEVVVSGVSPGADVYLFGGLQVGHTDYSSLVPVDLTSSDDDRDGVVRFAYPKGVPLRSVWIAVDQRNGEIAAGVPTGYTLKMTSIPPGAWKRKDGSSIDALALEHRALEFLVVHPGQATWRWQADQGSVRDDDGVNDGVLMISAEHLRPTVKKGPAAPHAFSTGDLVVAIDPFSLEVLTSRVPR